MLRTLAVALALLPAAAFAQHPSSSKETLVQPPPKHIDITDDEHVEGGVARPDGTVVGGRVKARQTSLIHIRADFLPEMIRSAERL